MQIAFFSLINFFQPTFIMLTLCTEHSFKPWVFKGKAAEASVCVICQVMAASGTLQVLLPGWAVFTIWYF